MIDFSKNAVLDKILGEERTKNTHFCQCNNCISLPTPRENYCCREVLSSNTIFARNIAKFIIDSKVKCVTEVPLIQEMLRNKTVNLFFKNFDSENPKFDSLDKFLANEYRVQ